jgi:Uma2 family endonuclease
MNQLLHPASELSLDDIQHFVLEDANWDLYEQLLKVVGNRPVRITYDDGRLEITSPLSQHDNSKKIIGRMIEMLAFLKSMEIASYGSTTFKSRKKSKGLEPDESYYFREEKKMRGRKRINLRNDPAPELVVEIDITSRSIAREPIYAALGVPEIWRWDGHALQCLHLVNGNYRNRKHSLVFPFLEPAQLRKFIESVPEKGENSAIRAFVAWVRENGWAS